MSSIGADMYRAIVQRGSDAKDGAKNRESTLELVWKPIPEAAPGYVVVNVTVRPVNPIYTGYIRAGSIASIPPFTPGSEGFGIVKAIGEGVTRVKPDQRVVFLPRYTPGSIGNGTWQEFVSVKEESIMPVPDSIPDEAAAQLVINPWTAIGLVQDLNVPKGEYLLQTAAGSALGRLVIQLAKHKGIKTINIVRRPEQKEELFALGADEVICSTTEDIVTRVKEITSGNLAYGALVCVGGDQCKAIVESLRRQAQVLIYGLMGSPDVTIGIWDLLSKEVLVKGWTLGGKSNDFEDLAKQAIELFEEKVFEPFVGEKFDLADFKKAIAIAENLGRGGKVLLTSERKSNPS